MNDCWQLGDACIPAQHQPALVLAYARTRELAPRIVLPGTGLEEEAMPQAGHAISPQQYLRLLANVAAGLNSADTSFMLGQQLLPGHFGALSHALMHAASLREALGLLTAFPVPLSPLLTPRLAEENSLAVLYWTDSFGCAALRGLVVEMQMTAVSAMCRWLSGERLPWRYCFNRTQPRYTEQYEVHLGARLRFNCHLDAMLIDAEWLDRPWPRANATAAAVALHNAAPAEARRPFVSALYDYLAAHVAEAPSLERSAERFGISQATLKRQLSRHGTHFQAELDTVRAHLSMRLMHRGYDNEVVARQLGFHDANNFRRSFKRWTGMTPMLLREGMQG